ncbi:DUF3971 domain-containing protein [Celeribacter arenosi]|uniref:AsmA-like C-terminal region-containing protein n=1 Tax=Celeribacter arenosi TaxID=792649 RepID=A0ABP7KDT2_9RHOB
MNQDADPQDPDIPPPDTHRHWSRRVMLWALAFVAFGALFATFGTLALTGREIVLPARLTERIETRINRDFDSGQVSLGRVVVMVDRNFIPRVTARNVGIRDASGVELARLNSLRAVLSREAVADFRFEPDVLRLSGAQIVIRRRVDGSFALDFGGSARTAGSGAEVLQAIDDAFLTEPLSGISRVEARELTVTLEDARTGNIWQATDASVVLSNHPDSVDITVNFALFNGTEDLSDIEISFSTQKTSLASSISLSADRVPASDFALHSPALSFLSVVNAPLSSNLRAEIDSSGTLSRMFGTIEIGAGHVDPGGGGKPIAFDGAKGYVGYDPKENRLDFAEVSLSSPTLNLSGRGHLLVSDFQGNWPQAFTGQLQLSDVRLDPLGFFEAPLAFGSGAVDLHLRLDPLRLNVGQFYLTRQGLTLRGDGRAIAHSDGWETALDLRVPVLSHADLLTLWPPLAVTKTRDWLAANLSGGVYRDLTLAFRRLPDVPKPLVEATWAFDNLTAKLLAAQPPLTGAAGYATLSQNALSFVVEAGQITAPQGGALDVAGSSFQLPDLSQKPANLEIALKSRSTVEAALSILSGKPLNALKDATFGPDVAEGQFDLSAEIAFPLKGKLQPADVTYSGTGVLSDVVSTKLIPDRRLAAKTLNVEVTQKGMEIAGPVTLDSARANGRWVKAFGAENRGLSSVTADVAIDQNFLDTFAIALPTGMFQGAAKGAVTVDLVSKQPPRFALTSDLKGATLNIPPIGWRKAAATGMTFSAKGTGGAAPGLSELTLVGDGLTARDGAVAIRAGGGLERLSFGQFAVDDWLSTSLRLDGQGAGAPPAVILEGGLLDLRKLPSGGGSGGDAHGPVTAALDTLRVSDGLRLTNLSAELAAGRDVRGVFSGYLNGEAALSGTLVPATHGPTITLTSRNAGRVVTAAGLLERAEGGAMTVTLVALPQTRTYDGRAQITDMSVLSAPSLAKLLSSISVVGLLEQLGGGGLKFTDINSEFLLAPERITIRQGSAEGASLGISLDGIYDTASKEVDFQGVISPLYFINALGQVVSRRGEGLFGFNFDLRGAASDPDVRVNPLSILTPGALRDIFRRRSPAQSN